MNRAVRIIVMIYSLLLAIASVIFLYAFIDPVVISVVASQIADTVNDPSQRWVLFSFLVVTVLSATWSISFVIISGRLGKTRIRTTDIGLVDIGADAIENIALNSAKMSQAGIKSAKARVSAGRKDMIRIHINAVLYSNVEVPAMMIKVQERVKKDIERYTGIQVETVSVKVNRVEPIVAKVER